MNKVFIFILVAFFAIQESNSQSWFQLNSGTTKSLSSVSFINENVGWCVGQNGILLKTTDGGSNWTQKIIASGWSLSDVYFVNEEIGWTVVAYPEGRIYKTTDGGNNWFLQRSISWPGYTAIQFADTSLGWAVNYFYMTNEILKTTNGGNTWLSTNIQQGYYDELQNIRFIDENNGFVVSSEGSILKSSDGGNNWNRKGDVDVWLNAVDFITPDTGWIVGNYGNIFKTTNGGIDWVVQISNTTEILNDIQMFDKNIGWIVGYGHILKTIDGGNNWIASLTGFTHSSVCFVNENVGWVVGGNGKIFKTTDGGALPVELTSFTASYSPNNVNITWTTATELNNHGFEIERCTDKTNWRTISFKEGKGTTSELQQYSYLDNVSDINTSKLYYRLKQIDYNGSYEYSNVVEVLITPAKFSLVQNYPNPFNPSTKISWQSPVRSWQSLKIYDILGNEVTTLVNEEKPAGNYEVEFDASLLSSGVYFYQLRIGSFVETRKMILLR